jgi:hypothetical protein
LLLLLPTLFFGQAKPLKDAALRRRRIDQRILRDFSKMFLAAPYTNLPGMKVSFEYVAATRADVWKHKPEEFADSSFVEALDKNGFIKKLYEK